MHTSHHSQPIVQVSQPNTEPDNLNNQNGHLPCCAQVEKANTPKKVVYGHTIADVEKQILDWLKDTNNSDEVNAINHVM